MSLNLSPTGEFLATAHVRNVGIFLWSNRTLYSHVSLKAIGKDDVIPEMGLPGSSAEIDEEEDAVVAAEPDYVSPERLDGDLITMSAVTRSRWQNLLDIDIIRRRNEPREGPKVPESAPFFLPTIPSLQLRFDLSLDARSAEKAKTRPDAHSAMQAHTSFGQSLLTKVAASDDFSDAVERLKAMGPSAIDFEIQSLSMVESCSEQSMLQFMKMIRYMMDRKTDFELSQAYLAVFLKWHGTTISANERLRNYIREVGEAQKQNWLILREKLLYNISVVQSLKKI